MTERGKKIYSSQNPLFTCYTICLIQYFLFIALYLKKTTEELEKELESILRKGSPNIWLGGVRFVLVFFWFLKNFFVGVVLVVFFFFHRHSFLPVIRGHQARESGSGSSQAMFSVFWMVHTGMAWSTALGLSKYSSIGRWEMSRKEFLLFPFVNVFLLSIRLLRVLRVTEKTKI